MTQYLQVIEELKLADDLEIKISISHDERNLYLNVDYKDGKFTIQRSFTNNYIGLEELSNTKEEFDSVEKVKKYFRL